MIDFEDILTGESVYRSEINPAASQSEDWVVDDLQIKLLPKVPTIYAIATATPAKTPAPV